MLTLRYAPGHTEHTDDCMSEWAENAHAAMVAGRSGGMDPQTIEMNHRSHMHDSGIHTDCTPSCEIGAMWDEAISTDDRLAAFDIKRKAHRCPACGVAPGADCLNADTGKPVRWIHWSRYTAGLIRK
jgi:hypothetical protein